MTNRCTFKQSTELKEIGFDMEVRDYYDTDEKRYCKAHSWNWNLSSLLTSAPTRSEVLQWAREKHGIDAWVERATECDTKQYAYRIYSSNLGSISCYAGATYPEAEDALIDKIIEILKEQKV